jgi:hypothetical protein
MDYSKAVDLDNLLMRLSVAEMTLRYDRTPADLEAFAVKLRQLSFEVERLANTARCEEHFAQVAA